MRWNEWSILQGLISEILQRKWHLLWQTLRRKQLFVASAITDTTGIKGTKQNLHGIFKALRLALEKVNATTEDLAEIRINEATPVIGDVAMETITETIITESTMIGHNPKTPGGLGMGSGVTVLLDDVTSKSKDADYIVIIPKTVDFEDAKKAN